ncbi:MAG: damage-inducible protein, partial [Dolichospermum sp.]
LQRKFSHELHCNEIVLLAYYIAAINIEESYHFLTQYPPTPLAKGGLDSPPFNQGGYQPFNGIVLTDTFQMSENDGYLLEKIFPENNQRVINQKQNDITVIIGNPPYSAKQESVNDNNQNLIYPQLDEKIRTSYVKYTNYTNKTGIYDSYIRGFRWATDRIEDKG